MTFTIYDSKWVDSKGQCFSGDVYWDKLEPDLFSVRLCPLSAPSFCEAPIWKASEGMGNSARSMAAAKKTLIRKLKARARRLKLTEVELFEVEFAPKK
jgi:hypothetical protein